MKKRALASALAAALLLQANMASAIGLVQAYEAALQNDPNYQAAIHDNEAGQQNRVLGRANLLPNLSASYGKNKNRAEITQPDFLGRPSTSQPEYTSSAAGINLRQPLLNLDGYARYKQGIAQTNYSDAVFSVRSQDLLIRLVSAYAEAKYAEDQLTLSIAQRDTYAEQRQVNERMFQRGEGTRTDMAETQARFDLAEAQVLEARDNMLTARNNLRAIVGVDVTELDPLSEDFKAKPMVPAAFEEWKATALERNTEIIAQRYNVEIAAQEINKNRAGHAPRVDLVAGLNKSESETLATRTQDSTVRSVGVQVSIPLYSGGSISALTTQAVANHERAKSDLDAKTTQVLVELRKQYDLSLSSIARIDALVKSVESARLLVDATQKSVKAGVRINLDVLNAQQQQFAAQRDLAQARYNYLVSYLRLRFAAGTLNAEDLHTVAGYFVKGGATVPKEPVLARQAAHLSPQAARSASADTVASAEQKATGNKDIDRDKVLSLLAGWTSAWSARDVQAYLGFYANEFQPEKGHSRKAWTETRTARIRGAAHIAVQAESADIVINGDAATVKFRQIYKSDRVSEDSSKMLVLAKQDGAWKITRERSEN